MSIRQLWTWLDKYLITAASLFLLIFIPLYPKLPLFEAIPGYLVRVRVEDILVLATSLLWIIQSLRGKVAWKNPFWGFIVSYAIIGLLSILSGIFLLQTIPLQLLHVGKSGLHYLRYLEYFSLLFFMFSGLTSLKQIKIALGLLAVCVMGASIYGFGQLYWQWPVYSTMNREFSKGEALTLTADARLNSTFGGHYDLAAYLVIVLPIIWTIIWRHPRRWVKVMMALVLGVGTWLLVVSGSKTALLAWALGMFVTTLLCLYRYQRLFKITLVISIFAIMIAGSIGSYFWFNPQNTWPITQIRHWQKLQLIQVVKPAGLALNMMEKVLVNHAQTQAKPYDLTGEGTWVEVPQVHEDGSISYSLVKKEEDWSENAIKYGLSMGIRLDTLWPQALRGEAKNLLLGSGYGTLNKTLNGAFIEADSTDNNLLRTLGETGLLGWLVFYGLIGWLLRRLLLALKDKNWVTQSLSFGLFGGTIGLLANSMIIDVFAASKVAFTFWALVGISAKSLFLTQPESITKLDSHFQLAITKLWQKSWPWLVSLILLILLIHRNPLFSNSRILSFSDDPWATHALTTARCGNQSQRWVLCREAGEQPSPNSYLYTRLLGQWLQLFPQIGSYYYLNLVLLLLSFSLYSLITKKVILTQFPRLIVLLLYAVSLFLSHQPFSAIDVNLSLLLLLLTVLAAMKFQTTGSPKWGSLTLGSGILAISTTVALSGSDFFFLSVPFLIIAVVKVLIKIWSLKPSFRGGLSFIAITTILLLSFKLQTPHRWQEVLLEYRGVSDSLRSSTIQTFNNYFTTWATITQPGSPPAWLLTVDNPYLWDFYRNQYYQLLPLSPYQPFFEQAKTVWGDHDYSSPIAMTQKLLHQAQPVFISEFGLTPQVGQPEWQQLFEKFNFTLVTAGCEERCNLYQVTDQPITFDTSVSFNQKPLRIAENDSYIFTFMGHRWHTQNPVYNHEPAQLLPILQQVHADQPDFSIMTGNLYRGSDEGYQEIFRRWWGNQARFPFFILPSNYDEIPDTKAGTRFQSFRVNQSVFILLDFDEKNELPREQQLAFYNALLDLQRSPEVKNLFIFTHKLEWLAQSQGYEGLAQLTTHPELSQEPSFYQTKILPKLKNLKNQKVFVVSGDLKPMSKPAVLYHQDEVSGISYLATGINNHPSDVFLKFAVAPDGQVTVAAASPTGQPLADVKTYDLEFWQADVPSVHQPVSVETNRSAISPWIMKLVFSILLGLLVSLIVTFQSALMKQGREVLTQLSKVRNRLLQAIRK